VLAYSILDARCSGRAVSYPAYVSASNVERRSYGSMGTMGIAMCPSGPVTVCMGTAGCAHDMVMVSKPSMAARRARGGQRAGVGRAHARNAEQRPAMLAGVGAGVGVGVGVGGVEARWSRRARWAERACWWKWRWSGRLGETVDVGVDSRARSAAGPGTSTRRRAAAGQWLNPRAPGNTGKCSCATCCS
jgi:hypothetical protein